MRIEDGIKLDFKDVLFKPKRSTLKSRSQVNLKRTYKFKHPTNATWSGVPLIAANMDTTGTFEMALSFAQRECVVALHKHYSTQDVVDFLAENPSVAPYIAVSAGTSEKDIVKLGKTLEACPSILFVVLDVANGYSEHFVATVVRVREAHPEHVIIAGNVVTSEMTEQLILSGADIVKVGIGPGSVCTTRKQTGVGYPQLSAVIECSEAAHGLGALVISDGGCACSGDVSKAFGAGSDFVMMGGMFAGHDESGGTLIERDGQFYKQFYGMSSATAMKKHSGGVAEYRASEGKSVEVPYRGPVDGTVCEILGGIRSTCTYIGAPNLKSLSKCTTFIRVSQQLNPVFNRLKHKDLPPGLRKAINKVAGRSKRSAESNVTEGTETSGDVADQKRVRISSS